MQRQTDVVLRRAARTTVMLAVVLAGTLVALAPSFPARAAGHALGPVPPEVQQARKDGQAACVQPPARRDPLSLSDVEIARYGFPPRPNGADAAALSRWTKLVGGERSRVCASHPVPGLRADSESSGNWAGYVNTGSGYTAAETTWQQPGLACQSGQGDTYVVFWAGLGGDGHDGGGNLVQDGTWSRLDSYCNPLEHWLWYEDCCTLDPGIQRWDGITYNDGDWMYAYADSNYSISGGNYYYVKDQTTGRSASAAEWSYPSNGSTAEAIAERPTVQGLTSTLANFNWVLFSSTQVRRNGSWPYMDTQPYNSSTMWHSDWCPGCWGDYVLAYPSSMGSFGTFHVYYRAS